MLRLCLLAVFVSSAAAGCPVEAAAGAAYVSDVCKKTLVSPAQAPPVYDVACRQCSTEIYARAADFADTINLLFVLHCTVIFVDEPMNVSLGAIGLRGSDMWIGSGECPRKTPIQFVFGELLPTGNTLVPGVHLMSSSITVVGSVRGTGRSQWTSVGAGEDGDLRVADASVFAAGDEVGVTGAGWAPETAERTVRGVNGDVLTLDRPVGFAPGLVTDPPFPAAAGHVVVLSRNVEFRGDPRASQGARVSVVPNVAHPHLPSYISLTGVALRNLGEAGPAALSGSAVNIEPGGQLLLSRVVIRDSAYHCVTVKSNLPGVPNTYPETTVKIEQSVGYNVKGTCWAVFAGVTRENVVLADLMAVNVTPLGLAESAYGMDAFAPALYLETPAIVLGTHHALSAGRGLHVAGNYFDGGSAAEAPVISGRFLAAWVETGVFVGGLAANTEGEQSPDEPPTYDDASAGDSAEGRVLEVGGVTVHRAGCAFRSSGVALAIVAPVVSACRVAFSVRNSTVDGGVVYFVGAGNGTPPAAGPETLAPPLPSPEVPPTAAPPTAVPSTSTLTSALYAAADSALPSALHTAAPSTSALTSALHTAAPSTSTLTSALYTAVDSALPSAPHTAAPSNFPSAHHTPSTSTLPSALHTAAPSNLPSAHPTPSTSSSALHTAAPSNLPSAHPTPSTSSSALHTANGGGLRRGAALDAENQTAEDDGPAGFGARPLPLVLPPEHSPCAIVPPPALSPVAVRGVTFVTTRSLPTTTTTTTTTATTAVPMMASLLCGMPVVDCAGLTSFEDCSMAPAAPGLAATLSPRETSPAARLCTTVSFANSTTLLPPPSVSGFDLPENTVLPVVPSNDAWWSTCSSCAPLADTDHQICTDSLEPAIVSFTSGGLFEAGLDCGEACVLGTMRLFGKETDPGYLAGFPPLATNITRDSVWAGPAGMGWHVLFAAGPPAAFTVAPVHTPGPVLLAVTYPEGASVTVVGADGAALRLVTTVSHLGLLAGGPRQDPYCPEFDCFAFENGTLYLRLGFADSDDRTYPGESSVTVTASCTKHDVPPEGLRPAYTACRPPAHAAPPQPPSSASVDTKCADAAAAPTDIAGKSAGLHIFCDPDAPTNAPGIVCRGGECVLAMDTAEGCSAACDGEAACQSFNYHAGSSLCRLFGGEECGDPTFLPLSGWTYYSSMPAETVPPPSPPATDPPGTPSPVQSHPSSGLSPGVVVVIVMSAVVVLACAVACGVCAVRRAPPAASSGNEPLLQQDTLPDSRLPTFKPKPARWHLEDVLGRGAFAKVYRGRCVETGEVFAVKVIDLTGSEMGDGYQGSQRSKQTADDAETTGAFKRGSLRSKKTGATDDGEIFEMTSVGDASGDRTASFRVSKAAASSATSGSQKTASKWGSFEAEMREVERFRNLQHPNIVQYHSAEVVDDHLCIIMELVPNGSIGALVRRIGSLPVERAKRYTAQMLSGIAYLHDNRIMHRDIKGENLLLAADDTLKVSDFGCSKFIAEMQMTAANTVVGTPRWMAPEVITSPEQGYPLKADIWSAGCTACEMLTGQPPWPEFTNAWTTMYHIAHNDPEIPSGVDPAASAFLQKLLQRDPTSRPTAREAVLDDWLCEEDEVLEGDVLT
ncbi:Mitogen-activated protein kinase kinase kinase 2 [Diplonema papillatum]|nr:Mitogen-activated protein kinase kinase kinase 2 [Diplonema papillatum]